MLLEEANHHLTALEEVFAKIQFLQNPPLRKELHLKLDALFSYHQRVLLKFSNSKWPSYHCQCGGTL
ncbi:hypothetical protein HanXRQr2_Chr13g0587211 [Helianthus annuus]|uniref:Uncharacterized protein n=1 Tax=Helianthus annuus TaxID=4232 RepID=A0A9K3EHR6_HELAN|nr:hypothetical protein HanXRQr2_Chr13g0587211 [Helianthus annuus]KAJ0849135.1 hypothetical protein HanPSC8_Chr13g0565431 [Helianthus annuus]